MPNSEQDTVEVFHFVPMQANPESGGIEKFMAPRDVIRRLGGSVLEGTGQRVPAAELDRERRYRRVATGWGELA